MREPGFVVTVSANTVLDAVSAYGLLHKKTEAGRLLHLYRLRAVHAGAFAAVWMLYNVPIEAVSTAIALATSGRELAELTVPVGDEQAIQCSGALEIWSAKGNYFGTQGVQVKRRFGGRRDLIETLVACTTLPTLLAGLLSPCASGRVSAMAEPTSVRAQTGPVTEWDVCPSKPATAPQCFSTLEPRAVEEPIGLFFLSSSAK
tara:strand:- start:4221 stop:4829 length:609 start_codon:yes stop_codon:yes gene_type:complete